MTRRAPAPEDFPNLPRHIAIIMDGNGRWAAARGRPRTYGHRVGARSTRLITEECARLGIERLTLYAFSAENWKRPREEVDFLMSLLSRYLVRERKTLLENNIRLEAIGRLETLPAPVRRRLEDVIAASRPNDGLSLCMALNYGGRAEIIDAARRAMQAGLEGALRPEELDEARFAEFLYAGPGVPDPDLLIRTGGDFRVSNFLLWEISYAEIVVTDVPWPQFRAPELHRILREYGRRERRFGGLGPASAPTGSP
ncbi:MAG: di-trans,poly-cis-decaprenylcistransferase [Planctomycetes bacterium]|nr:di-trans,poly-cis-decaprenylcistransferase [Planctomycetota bacterium]